MPDLEDAAIASTAAGGACGDTEDEKTPVLAPKQNVAAADAPELAALQPPSPAASQTQPLSTAANNELTQPQQTAAPGVNDQSMCIVYISVGFKSFLFCERHFIP